MDERDILNLIRGNRWMMDVLQAAQRAALPDWVIGAGFVRNPVWDHLHGREPALDTDVDLVYFERGVTDKETEKKHETKLKNDFQADWSVKNQARMHLKHGDDPYRDTEDALAHWVETATCVGVRLGRSGDLILVAPHGIDDLVNLVVRPGPLHSQPEQVVDRVRDKRWLERWPRLRLKDLPE